MQAGGALERSLAPYEYGELRRASDPSGGGDLHLQTPRLAHGGAHKQPGRLASAGLRSVTRACGVRGGAAAPEDTPRAS